MASWTASVTVGSAQYGVQLDRQTGVVGDTLFSIEGD